MADEIIDNELMLVDRQQAIKSAFEKYGEDNFYIAFSGGKDSTILHHLVDMAVPNNKVPRVFSNTGIEYKAIVDFVKELSFEDSRFTIITSRISIKKMLEEKGYPFKSKEHSLKLGLYQKGSRAKSVINYKESARNDGGHSTFGCPKALLYQYDKEFALKVSDRCCYELKKTPFHNYEKESKRRIAITGMQKSEGGQRKNKTHCIITRGGKVVKFHPLLNVNDEWEEWFIKKFNIKLCSLYSEPFNFKRTGCKGCPYSTDLEQQLELMALYLPSERKQCEIIWKPVYEEYRRIGYRLKKNEQQKLF